MACFLVPAAEAAVVTVATKVMEHKAKKTADSTEVTFTAEAKGSMINKMKWLTNLLWGGALLLMFEHVWHGEITAWFPFLTAAADPEEAAVMLHEMSTVGVAMAVLVTAVWACMVLASKAIEKRNTKEEEAEA